jgi:DNA-binding CsgD family transcriptional regulator
MRLSAREGQVLVELALNGGTDREIARRLGISRATVRTHEQHLRAKLGAHSRTELAAMFWRRGGHHGSDSMVIRTRTEEEA